MTGNFFGIVILICGAIILINYICNPQETKKNYSTFWFILKSLWEKRKTSPTYKKVTLGWFFYIILSLSMRYTVLTATREHNSALTLIASILLVALLIFSFTLTIYSSYEVYHAAKEILSNKDKALRPTQTPAIIYWYDSVYVLLMLFPYCARLLK